jgi:energy coupling factor transporter S component ThiW
MEKIAEKTEKIVTRRRNTTRKMVLTAMLAGLAFVLNTCVYFPAMAPFQHFVDVLAAVLLGPWYACVSALLCGILRMLTGRTIQAVTGAVFGPILGGLLYRKTKKIPLVFVGEVVGTGFFGAMASYPLMKLFYGLDAQSPFYFIPFYTPSAVVGAGMGVCVLLVLKRTGTLDRMLNRLHEGEKHD